MIFFYINSFSQNFLPNSFSLISGHSTSKMAGKFAAKINSQKLILNHFSHRYKGDLNKQDDVKQNKWYYKCYRMLKLIKIFLKKFLTLIRVPDSQRFPFSSKYYFYIHSYD